jgi:hypothetical protein
VHVSRQQRKRIRRGLVEQIECAMSGDDLADWKEWLVLRGGGFHGCLPCVDLMDEP